MVFVDPDVMSTSNEVKRPKERVHKILKISHSPKQLIDDSEFWREYNPEVKVRILQSYQIKGLFGLRREFNIADLDLKLKRTG